MSDEESNDKLYIKTKCSFCLGGIRKGVFVNCPYCDVDRKSFIEAPLNSIKDIVKSNFSKTEIKELIKYIQEEE